MYNTMGINHLTVIPNNFEQDEQTDKQKEKKQYT